MSQWLVSTLQYSPAAGLLGFFIYVMRLIYTGRLVPRSAIIDLKTDFKDQIERERQISENYRLANMTTVEVMQKISHQNDLLIENFKTVEALIAAIPRPPRESARPGGNPEWNSVPGSGVARSEK